MKISKSGSLMSTVGMCCFVAAIAAMALGSGGYAYMDVNPDAVRLVAGCALFGATLLAVGIIFMVCGFRARFDAVAESIESIERRLDTVSRDEDHRSPMLEDDLFGEHASHAGGIEARLRDVMRLVAERNEIRRQQIGGGECASTVIAPRVGSLPAQLLSKSVHESMR